MLAEVGEVVLQEEAEEADAAAEGLEVGAAEGVGEEGLDKGVEAVEDGLGGDAEEEEGGDELRPGGQSYQMRPATWRRDDVIASSTLHPAHQQHCRHRTSLRPCVYFTDRRWQ